MNDKRPIPPGLYADEDRTINGDLRGEKPKSDRLYFGRIAEPLSYPDIDFPKFKWQELHKKTLEMFVSVDHGVDSNKACTVIAGQDKKTGIVYILNVRYDDINPPEKTEHKTP